MSKVGIGMVEVVLAFPSYYDHIVPEASLTCAGEIKLIPDHSTLVQLPWYPNHQAVIVNAESSPGLSHF